MDQSAKNIYLLHHLNDLSNSAISLYLLKISIH